MNDERRAVQGRVEQEQARRRRRRELLDARREVEHEAELRDDEAEEQDLVAEDRLHERRRARHGQTATAAVIARPTNIQP